MDRVRKRIHLDEIADFRWGNCPITIGVLDSGMNNHPDLIGKCICFYDFINLKKNPYDDYGHGTHVCGILCGSGEASLGKYKGIIPSAKLVVGKVLDEKGEGKAEVMLQALEWIWKIRKSYDIRLLNISVGIGDLKDKQKCNKLKYMIERLWDAGVVVVCAAGNKGPGNGTISDIGGSEKVITVGCYDDLNQKAEKGSCQYYSGRGEAGVSNRKPDLVAPGTGIVSCSHEYVFRNGEYHSLYTAKTGTSMATPIVTGCAALLLQKEPYLNNNKIKDKLHYSAEDLGKPWNHQGWGMVHAKNLMEIL